jgi:hypothetical protein
LNITRTATPFLSLFVLAGCANSYGDASIVTNFPTGKQQMLHAAASWNIIAGDVAKQISASLKRDRPLHVSQAGVKTSFNRAFSNQLISALVTEGFTVLKTSEGALTVEIDTQAVRFSPNRPQYSHAGVATALTAGVWALHQAKATAWALAFAGIATADAISWFHSEFATDSTPRTEIIITASVTDDSQYMARSTSIYYVAEENGSLYQPSQTQTKIMEVTGQ